MNFQHLPAGCWELAWGISARQCLVLRQVPTYVLPYCTLLVCSYVGCQHATTTYFELPHSSPGRTEPDERTVDTPIYLSILPVSRQFFTPHQVSYLVYLFFRIILLI